MTAFPASPSEKRCLSSASEGGRQANSQPRRCTRSPRSSPCLASPCSWPCAVPGGRRAARLRRCVRETQRASRRPARRPPRSTKEGGSCCSEGADRAHFVVGPRTTRRTKGGKKPNIVVIMGDDVGWFNIGAYHHGMMAGRTPNLDKLAGAGHDVHRLLRRGELHGGPGELHHRPDFPIRTGHDDRGPGGFQDRPAGRGADHRHGDEVDGLRDGPVRQEPPRRPQRVPAHGPRLRRVLRLPVPPRRDGRPARTPTTRRNSRTRSARATWSTAGPRTRTTTTVQPRWGKVGKQKIEDAGTLYPKRMETVDDEILEHTFAFMDKAKKEDKPFFVWLNPTRMHVVTHLSDKYQKMRNVEERLVDPGGGDGPARRHRRVGHEEAQGPGRRRRTPSSSSPPTTARRTSPGPTAGRLRSPAARARRWRAASASPPSSAGRARCRRARSRTASSPASTGSPPSSPPPATRTSSTS